MKHLEDNLQKSCVLWFRYQFPRYSKLLFAVPNGGKRNIREAERLKSQGVIPGVSDLILMIPKNGLGSLCIEMKIEGGRQTINQREWQEQVEKVGIKYEIARSIDEFMNIINKYLNE